MSAPLTPEEIYSREAYCANHHTTVKGYDVILSAMKQYADQQTAALREELACTALALDHEKSFRSVDKKEFNELNLEIQQLKEELERQQRIWGDVGKDLMQELEAVKKESETSRLNHAACEEALSKLYTQWQDLFKERDQAFDLLTNYPSSEPAYKLAKWFDDRRTLLSSRENKPNIIDPDFENGMMEGH